MRTSLRPTSAPPAPFEPIVIASSEALRGTLDLDAMLPSYGAAQTVKGMFFAQRVEALGGLEPYVEQLVSPPRFGRYVPFSDYPTRDYMFLVNRTVEKLYAAVGPRQGIRQLARDDLRIFGESVLGRVMLGVARDARGTLLAAPQAFAAVAKGLVLEAEERSAATIRMTFREDMGCWEYNLGQLEGMVAYHGGSSVCTVSSPRPTVLVIDVEIRGGR